MLIAVMSDTHDNIWNLRSALDLIRDRGAEMIIHCGDFVAPFVLRELEPAGIPVHGVFGNNDGDQFLLTKTALTHLSNIVLHGLLGEIEVKWRNIAFTHYRKVAEGLAHTGRYDLVCFGHSHKHVVEKIGDCLLLNPGEVMGKEGEPGFCLVEVEQMTVERVEIIQG